MARCLVGETTDYCLIEAESPEEMIAIFHNYEGAVIGGEGKKALWIDTAKEILQLPDCSQRHKNNTDELICGELDPESESGNGEFGMCVLSGYDPPFNCPVGRFQEDLSQIPMPNSLELIEVEEYRLVRPRQSNIIY